MNRPNVPSDPLDGLDPPEGCPQHETLAEYAERTLAGASRAAVADHVPTCDRCRSVLASLARAGLVADGALGDAPVARLRRLPRWIPLVAAAALLVVGLVVALHSRETADSGTDARLVAVAARLAADRPALFAGFRPLSSAERGALPAPTQRGGLRRMTPAGTTAEVRPTFAWDDVDGASGYAITILDADGRRVLAATVPSARLEGSALPQPLPRDGHYLWKVVAVGAPSPAEGTRALHVAGDQVAREAGDVVEAIGRLVDPDLRDLAIAHALLRRGLDADALPFAERWAAAHPGDAVGRETVTFAQRRGAAGGGGR